MPLYASYLPTHLFGVPMTDVPVVIMKRRNQAIWAVGVEILFCLGCAPLGFLRGGLGRASAVINAITLIMAFVGMRATLRLQNHLLLSHWLLIYSLSAMFLLYILSHAELYDTELWLAGVCCCLP